MWVKAATRRELIDILQAERSVEPREALFSRYDFSAVSSLSSVYSRSELLLVWHDDPRDMLTLPNAIVVDSGEQKDFFAWAQTYLQALRPLTAYIRVSDYETAEQNLKIQNPPTLHRLENACVGLILGETATYVEGQRDLFQTSVRTSEGTHSFAMARALALGTLKLENNVISTHWFNAREITKQTDLSLSPTVLLTPWRVLLRLENPAWHYDNFDLTVPEAIFEACSDLYIKGELDSRRLYALDSAVPGISDLAETIRGPREQRVMALEETAENLRMRSIGADPTTFAFAVGYLASQVGPGTLDHLRLLTPYLHSFPGVLLWYGLCAGLHRRSTVAGYADGLGRRILRDLLAKEAFLDRPSCDISIAELQVVTATRKTASDFRTSSNTQVEVEIAPCVKTVMRWPPRSDFSDRMFPSSGVSMEEIKILQEDLLDSAEQIRQVSHKLASLAGGFEGRRPKADRKQRRR